MCSDATRTRGKGSCRWSWHSISTFCLGWWGNGLTWNGWAAASEPAAPAKLSWKPTADWCASESKKFGDELDKVRQRRSQYMERRRRTDVRMATLVGYTNAGKSTLFNALCDAGVPAEDQLFNTLDPVTRRLNMPDGGELLLSDTVGFIQKLSPIVVAAFRATLENCTRPTSCSTSLT